MKKYSRRRTADVLTKQSPPPPPSSSTLSRIAVFAAAVFLVTAATAAAAETADSPTAVEERPAAEMATEMANGGGVMDMIPFRALQLYNTVTGFLEYLYDTVIAPLTGNFKCFPKCSIQRHF